MEPSGYQRAVFKHFEKRAGHAAVVSVAGSGKTWTALEGIGHIPRFYSVLLGAFNTDIRVDFERRGRAAGYRHVRYTTYNAFGWSICLNEMQSKPVLVKEKTDNLLEATMEPDSEEEEKRFRRLRPVVRRLVSLFKSLNIHSADDAAARFDEVVDHHAIDVPEDRDFQDLLFATFRRSLEDTSTMDFDDQKYMPLHLGMNVPVFDQVILDEFQDTCEVEMTLMTAAARGGQFCGIGDPDQSIYGFKGATPDNFARFIREMGARELPLSICYRCPASVVAEAKKIVPRIEAAPGARPGVVDTVQKTRFHRDVRPGDFVLCRVTDQLVRECLRCIREGQKAKVRGRDIGDALVALINRVCGGNTGMPTERFLSELFQFRARRGEVLRKARREQEVERLNDQVDTVHALCEECGRVADVLEKANSIFCEDDEKHSGVDFMTIHKSKGLQCPRVWVLRPDLLPHPRSEERAWMLAEERRLKYVAITRAEEQLLWVLKAPGEK